MRFIALHSGRGPTGRQWRPAFEIVAPHQEAVPESIHPLENADLQGLGAARDLLAALPDITAGRLAVLSDPSGIGWLAHADTGRVIYTPRGKLDDGEQWHWEQLNEEGYGAGHVGTWVSEYDYDRRTLTLTWADPVNDEWHGVMRSLVRDDRLSDPEDRFQVFVAGDPVAWSDPVTGGIVKIVARIEDDGYFAAWHPGFPEDPWICEGTMWGMYWSGGMKHPRNPEYPVPRHWVYPTPGGPINPTRMASWANAAHNEWLKTTAGRLDRPRNSESCAHYGTPLPQE